MSKISLVPPSGFRDFSPAETLLRQNLISLIGTCYQKYGFQPIQVSTLENLPVLQGKGGGTDNEKLIFRILRRGDDLKKKLESSSFEEIADMGLRFDLTLPLARYYASRKQELPRPFKVYHIAPVWRADRPQKGRYREFFQCDVDILGSEQIGAELECISAITDVFRALSILDIKIVLNDRRLLAGLGASLGVAAPTWQSVLVALDKLDKIGAEGVKKEISEKALLTPEALAKLDALILSNAEPKLEDWLPYGPEAVASLTSLLGLLQANYPEISIRFAPTLVRGQDYYTGTIFEFQHASLSGSLGGGGRYDRLLELFQGETVPAFGGSLGFERLCLILEEKNTAATIVQKPQVFFPLFDESLRGSVAKLASSLRKIGLRVDVFPDAAKLKNQFKYADERQVQFTVLLGDDEEKRSVVKVKDMAARTEQEISQKDLAKHLESLCK